MSDQSGRRGGHSFEFTVHGATYDEVDTRAREICILYFGTTPHRYRVRAEVRQPFLGLQQQIVAATVVADKILSSEESRALYPEEVEAPF